MRLLLLAGPGPQRDRLVEAVGGIGADEVRVADDWAGLIKAVAASKPQAMLLSHATLSRRGPAALHAADVTLAALGVPAVIVLDADEADRRPTIEASTRFEYFLTPPHDARRLAHVLELAMHLSADVSAVPGTANAADDEADAPPTEFVRERTPKATPAHGVATAWDPPAAPSPGRDADKTVSGAVASTGSSAAAFFGRTLSDSALDALAAVDTREVDAVGEAEHGGREVTEPGRRPLTEPGRRPPTGQDEHEPPPGTPRAPIAPPAPLDLSESGASSSGESSATRRRDPGSGSGTLEDPIALGSESGATIAVDIGPATESAAEPPMFPESSPVPPPGRDDSGLWTGSSASIRLPRPDPSLPQLTMEMPNPNEGSLASVPVPQILITLSMARATGELTLTTGSLSRKVVVLDGDPGTVFQPPTPDDEAKLLSTFVWTTGSYRFAASDVPVAKFHPFGDPMSLVFRGIVRHFGLNETATALGPYLRKFPVQTDHIRRFRRVQGLEKLPRFLRAADGSKTLENLIAEAGAETEHLLCLAYFAWLAGCVVFADATITGPIPVDFDIPRIAPAMTTIQHRGTGTGASGASSAATPGSGGRPTAASDAAAARAPGFAPPQTPPPAASSPREDEQRRVLESLTTQWERLSGRGPYELFELEPGCGIDAINARFYELVRTYHPDRYATVQSPQVQALAEKIFLHIRAMHTRMAEQERGGPISPDAVGGAALDSGVQRRRRRAAAMSGASPRTGHTPPGVPRTEAAGADTSGSHAHAGHARRFGDTGESGPYTEVAPAGSGAHAAARASTYRGLTAEQLIRNARAATEQGNYGKAMELLQVARARGGTGPVLEAYSIFLAYSQEYMSASEAIDNLDELLESADDPLVKSAVLTLCGHACRIEEVNKEAVKYYERAIKEQPDNESAARWLRYLRRRMAEDDKKKPFSSSFLNKLFTPKPK